MSYNGIGLRTARGTGTNGYVQKNASYVRPRPTSFQQQHASMIDYNNNNDDDFLMKEQRKPNLEILEHAKKRQVELKCLEFREELLSKLFPHEKQQEEEMEEEVKLTEEQEKALNEKVQELRDVLMAEYEQMRMNELKV